MSEEEKDARRGVQSVEIAFRLLSALQTSVRPLPLKEVAALSGLSPSAASNYLVSLVRTGLVVGDARPGCYKLGPASLALGMSAISQLDSFEVVRREAIALRDATLRSVVVTTWSADGLISLFKQEGEIRGVFELRTGLIPAVSTSGGRIFIAYLPKDQTEAVVQKEWPLPADQLHLHDEFQRSVRTEIEHRGYVATHRADTGYASAAAPIWDLDGELRFAISVIGTQSTLDTEPGSSAVQALLGSAARATTTLSGYAKPR